MLLPVPCFSVSWNFTSERHLNYSSFVLIAIGQLQLNFQCALNEFDKLNKYQNWL